MRASRRESPYPEVGDSCGPGHPRTCGRGGGAVTDTERVSCAASTPKGNWDCGSSSLASSQRSCRERAGHLPLAKPTPSQEQGARSLLLLHAGRRVRAWSQVGAAGGQGGLRVGNAQRGMLRRHHSAVAIALNCSE